MITGEVIAKLSYSTDASDARVKMRVVCQGPCPELLKIVIVACLGAKYVRVRRQPTGRRQNRAQTLILGCSSAIASECPKRGQEEGPLRLMAVTQLKPDERLSCRA